MPKRMLDSSYLNSPSVDRCSPRAQDNFPRFILLADDFGCFEADTRRLLALGWTSRRTDVTEADIWSWLEEYAAVGMACLWTEKDRRWCYLTGWHGEHGQKHRQEYDEAHPKGSKRHTPRPPPDLVQAVVSGSRRDHDGKPPGTDRETETEKANDSVPARESEVSRFIPGLFPVDSRQFPGNFPGSAVPVVVGTTAVPGSGTDPRASLLAPLAPTGAATPAPTRRKAKAADPALDALRADLEATYRDVRREELDWPGSAYGDLQAIRKSLADDAEVKRRWCLFLADKFWPVKNVHKFRDAFQHAKFLNGAAKPKPALTTIPEYREGVPRFS